ncbi:lipocalin family protein [Polaribacter ponticola]|uniref:Lipocalin family protein n=1 Tax=Polaribacter ponticola TaxID=2978475 RepID=A0ABT5SAK3_9FLAO|nr:lipocalin family protein [Polaribacter sp. MSW5]MDD7915142.1 lipocalin family protein [Polaribacter sp. MSW5]
MKKVFLFLSIFALTFSSCTPDSEPIDQFIGEWTTHQIFEDGVEEQLDECELKNDIIVNSDGTYTVSIYYMDGSTGSCVLGGTENGTWENISNSVYRVTFDGETQDVKIIFESNTFSITTTDSSGTYKEVYIRK